MGLISFAQRREAGEYSSSGPDTRELLRSLLTVSPSPSGLAGGKDIIGAESLTHRLSRYAASRPPKLFVRDSRRSTPVYVSLLR